MKLERLETLKLISTKNLIVGNVLRELDKKFYYSKYELEIHLALILFTLLGDTELHKVMEAEDVDWINLVNENYHLIEELKSGEYKDIYNELFEEIERGAQAKSKYNSTISSFFDDLSDIFSEDNLRKIMELVNKEIEKSSKDDNNIK